MNAQETARMMSDAVNAYSFNNKAFCEQMGREHRTLQQSFTRLCFEWIRYCAEMEHYDDRNRASVENCGLLKEVMDEQSMYLPLV